MSGPFLTSVIATLIAVAILWGGRFIYPATPSRGRTVLKMLFRFLAVFFGVLFTVLAMASFHIPFDRPDTWWPLGICGLVISALYYEKLIERVSDGRD